MKLKLYFKHLLIASLLVPGTLFAQDSKNVATADSLTLEQVVNYALENTAAMEQALIDEQIGEREIRASLSGWFPQISANFGGTYNIKRQQQPIGGEIITFGQKYNSNIALQATQSIFDNNLFLASKASRSQKLLLDQQVIDTRINTVVEVSKAYYNVLLTKEQLRILDQNISRQEKQYNDARSRYEVGIVDKTDYQRAAITLANIRSDRKRVQESIKASLAYLKQLMGYPVEQELNLTYNYGRMEQEVQVDTTELIAFDRRIELQQLQTQRDLLKLNTAYNRWSFLPTVSAFANYNLLYFNNDFANLYNQHFPNSSVGIQASLPIFQGTRRLQNLKIAQLQEDRLDVQIEDTRRAINTEYQTALANYKGDYTEWRTVQQNLVMAEEVYEIIKLQYDEGVKAYVDLIVAETELRTTQLNYYNALYSVLSSKLDLQRALGNIDINR
ncbi:TolC family protein [Pontibacter sp. HSC-36F09]|uniref:TolC family protein n=1 Tax=Pontibacter sp. HSC-36F09 TaxID=2910966 RepID=UPI0020A0F126|nr:TolC family protein [Pontibacter sp. HSC-36F09]MCP2045343.1 outer membrane protein TolC [Pontibacter sp. HSC-36F09]